MKVEPLQLRPGNDLRQALETWMGEQEEQAGCVISAVGTLSVAQLRFAGAAEATTIHGELEILSLSGTLSPDGVHLHIAIADSSGAVMAVISALARWCAPPQSCWLACCRSGISGGSWIWPPATPSCESVLRLRAEERQPPVQSSRSSSTIDTVLAPMRRPRSRKRPSLSSFSRFTVIGWGQRRSASGWRKGCRWRQLSPPMLSTTNWRSCCSSVEVICDLVAAVTRVLATQVRFCGSR